MNTSCCFSTQQYKPKLKIQQTFRIGVRPQCKHGRSKPLRRLRSLFCKTGENSSLNPLAYQKMHRAYCTGALQFKSHLCCIIYLFLHLKILIKEQGPTTLVMGKYNSLHVCEKL